MLSLLAAFATSGTAWLFGLGFNAFSAVADTIGQGYSHSTFVDVFAELGIPAFCVLIAIVLSGVRCGRALFNRYRDDPPRRAAVAALLAMITYQVLLSNKEGNLWSSVNLFMFIIVINRIEACTRIEGMEFDKQSPIDTETAH
jgi:O-antigen ligase